MTDYVKETLEDLAREQVGIPIRAYVLSNLAIADELRQLRLVVEEAMGFQKASSVQSPAGAEPASASKSLPQSSPAGRLSPPPAKQAAPPLKRITPYPPPVETKPCRTCNEPIGFTRKQDLTGWIPLNADGSVHQCQRK